MRRPGAGCGTGSRCAEAVSRFGERRNGRPETALAVPLAPCRTGPACRKARVGFRFSKESTGMPTITTEDGMEIFYKDWGSGQPILFSHGRPLSSADDWDAQMLFFLGRGYRVVAHDRRGHGGLQFY